MSVGYPDEWHELSAYDRDVLVAVVDEPGRRGIELYEAVAGEETRTNDDVIYKQLNRLSDAGLVESTGGGRGRTYHPTERGERLVALVAKKWQGVA